MVTRTRQDVTFINPLPLLLNLMENSHTEEAPVSVLFRHLAVDGIGFLEHIVGVVA